MYKWLRSKATYRFLHVAMVAFAAAPIVAMAETAVADAADKPVVVSVVERDGDWGFRIEGAFLPEGRLGTQMDAAIAEGKSRFAGKGEPRFVELNSSGGVHSDAKVVAGLIHLTKLNTRVLGDDSCKSACILVLMGGHSRSVDPNAKIGVHQNRVVTTSDGITESEAIQNLFFDYFRFAALGKISPHLMGFISYVPHEDMALLPAECVSYLNLDNVHVPPTEGCSYDSHGLFPILGQREFGEIKT